MTPLPGVTYEERDAVGTSGPPLDTATAFIGGLAERGPVDRPVFITTPEQHEAIYGEDFAPGYLSDAARILPAESAAGYWAIRCVGEDAAVSTAKLTDGSKDTLQVDAVDPGEWGDDIDVVTTVGGGNVTYTVKYRGTTVEVSPALGTNAEAVAWAKASEYVRFTDLGGGDPSAQEVSLAGGDDDRGSITDEDRAACLALFTKDLGPGQVLWPGATTTAMYEALLKHAKAHNRIALLDGADTHTVATLTGAAATLRALGGDLATFGGMFAPWAVVPGTAASTERTIPYSIIQAALIARRDLATVKAELGVGNPNEPAAGTHEEAGVSRVATRLSQEPWTDAERETLNNAGVNVIREIHSSVVTYGYRTLTNPTTDDLNLRLNNRRIDMAILAAAQAIGEDFEFRDVDGRGRVLNEFASQLIGRVLKPYTEIGALFDKPEGTAYSVDVGEQVNPVKQLAEGKVVAQIGAKRSPYAEQVKIVYTKEAL